MELEVVEIAQKLISLGYDEKNAHSLGERLAASEEIREPLTRWLASGEETDCTYEEISALVLMRERGFTYPNALNTIAWLHSEPEIARKALSCGVDTVIRRKH